MPATTTGSFGFGKDVVGAPAGTAETVVRTPAELTTAIANAATANASLITFAGGEYNFDNEAILVRGRNITLKRQTDARVALNNVRLQLDVSSIDQILIRGLVFHSDGEAKSARDAIELTPPDVVEVKTVGDGRSKARVRITHCSFDGYYDIAIDSRSSDKFPQLLVTIDGCLFFDSNPGQPTTLIGDDPAFVNRGAINFGSRSGPGGAGHPQLRNDAHVTVARNVFISVWRRCPRVANGNFGHIFNNLVYQWGVGNTENTKTNKTNAWVGMEVGHGDGVIDGKTNGSALIEANRFIPYELKDGLDRTIDIGPNTKVDIGTTNVKPTKVGIPPGGAATGSATGDANPRPLLKSGLPNRFDDKDGKPQPTVTLPEPPDGFANLSVKPFEDVNLPRPPADDANTLDWMALVNEAGPRGVRASREESAKLVLLNILKVADS